MIKIRFQAVGKSASSISIPKEFESPIPFRVDDHVDHLNNSHSQHLVVVNARYVVDEPKRDFYQLVSVATNSA